MLALGLVDQVGAVAPGHDAQFAGVVVDGPGGPRAQVGPEPRVARRARPRPGPRPAVGRHGGDAPEFHRPQGDHRLVVGRDHGGGRTLAPGGQDDAAEGGDAPDAHHRGRVGLDNDRVERHVADRRLAHHADGPDEHLWQHGRVDHAVEHAPALLGHGAQGRHVGVVPHRDGGDLRARGEQRGRLARQSLGLEADAVAENDHVLGARLDARELDRGGVEGGGQVRAPRTADAQDGLLRRLGVLVRASGHDDGRAVRERDDADLVAGVQCVDRGRHGPVGDLLLGLRRAEHGPAHRAGAVEHEDHGGLGRDDAVGDLQPDRQRVLDRRAAPAARGQGAAPADEDQPAPEVAGVGVQTLGRALGQGVNRHVVQHDQVVVLQREQVDRERGGDDGLDLAPRGAERGGERAGGRLGGVDDEHRAGRSGDGEARGPVVGDRGVAEQGDAVRAGGAVGLEDRLVPVDAPVGQGEADGDDHAPAVGLDAHAVAGFARGQVNRAALAQHRERAAGRAGRAHHDAGVDLGVGRGACGQVEGLDDGLAVDAVDDRQDVNGHVQADVVERAAGGAAVRDEHDASLGVGGQHGAGESQGGGHVGAVHRVVGAGARQRVVGAGGGQGDGAPVEDDKAEGIVRAASFGATGQGVPGGVLGRHGAAVLGPPEIGVGLDRCRQVHHPHHRDAVGPPVGVQARQRQGAGARQEHPGRHRRGAAHRRHRPEPPPPQRGARQADQRDQQPARVVHGPVHGASAPWGATVSAPSSPARESTRSKTRCTRSR